MKQGFSPHDAHTHTAWFAWIIPTIKTTEFTVLQIVGLDAVVVCTYREVLEPRSPVLQLLNFFKMTFYLFSISAVVICAVMVPLNLYVSLNLCLASILLIWRARLDLMYLN
jgi:calcium permeable stress-gated cation channel